MKAIHWFKSARFIIDEYLPIIGADHPDTRFYLKAVFLYGLEKQFFDNYPNTLVELKKHLGEVTDTKLITPVGYVIPIEDAVMAIDHIPKYIISGLRGLCVEEPY